MMRAGITALMGLGRRRVWHPPNTQRPAPLRTAGVYVDVENLKNPEHVRFVVEMVVRNWPVRLPPLRRICLYVPATKTGLWHAWLTGRFPHMETFVRGIQHYARTSKNAADMAIVADAITDFTTRAVHHISVVSNDSDFGVLYEKLRELVPLTGKTTQPPFLWILPEGCGVLSSEIIDFFPGELCWSLPAACAGTTLASTGTGGGEFPENGKIARWLLDQIPVGKFRSGDIHNIICQRFPNHPAVQNPSTWGMFFSQQLLPLLGDKVRVVRPKSPRTYEKTAR